MAEPASNEKSAAQVIEELRADRDAWKRLCEMERASHARDMAAVEKATPLVETIVADAAQLRSDLAEARRLLQAWLDGKEPGLETSRWLHGRQG